MQQQNKPAQNDKALQGFLPWIVLGIGVLVVLVGIIVSSMLKDKSPPRPVGPAARIPKVNLIIHSNVGGAEVYLNDQQKAIVSDTQHKATLFNLAPKTYQITVKKQGVRRSNGDCRGNWTNNLPSRGNQFATRGITEWYGLDTFRDTYTFYICYGARRPLSCSTSTHFGKSGKHINASAAITSSND